MKRLVFLLVFLAMFILVATSAMSSEEGKEMFKVFMMFSKDKSEHKKLVDIYKEWKYGEGYITKIIVRPTVLVTKANKLSRSFSPLVTFMYLDSGDRYVAHINTVGCKWTEPDKPEIIGFVEELQACPGGENCQVIVSKVSSPVEKFQKYVPDSVVASFVDKYCSDIVKRQMTTGKYRGAVNLTGKIVSVGQHIGQSK